MVEEAESLQIAAIFVLSFASFLGIYLPFALPHDFVRGIIPFVNALAAGVMLGLALIHLMPDSDDMLSDLYDDYPLCNAFVGFGVIFTLTIEQLVFISCQPHENATISAKGEPGKVYSSVEEDGLSVVEVGKADGNDDSKKENNTEMSSQKALVETHCHHDHEDHAVAALHALSNAATLKDLITAYAIEISTAMHSVIIGFDFGVLTQDDMSTLRILFAVLVFHQFAEGLGLGSVMKTSEKQLGGAKVISFMVIFSCTISIGIILGLAIKPGDESDLQKGLEGTATAIAAGSLLYIVLVELVGVYFNLPELEKNSWKKLVMLGLFFLGAMVMGIIGIWD